MLNKLNHHLKFLNISLLLVFHKIKNHQQILNRDKSIILKLNTVLWNQLKRKNMILFWLVRKDKNIVSNVKLMSINLKLMIPSLLKLLKLIRLVVLVLNLQIQTNQVPSIKLISWRSFLNSVYSKIMEFYKDMESLELVLL